MGKEKYSKIISQKIFKKTASRVVGQRKPTFRPRFKLQMDKMDSCEQVLGDAFNLVETFGFGPISSDHHFDILDIPFTPSRLARIMEKKTVVKHDIPKN